jgi:hypothetical protein
MKDGARQYENPRRGKSSRALDAERTYSATVRNFGPSRSGTAAGGPQRRSGRGWGWGSVERLSLRGPPCGQRMTQPVFDPGHPRHEWLLAQPIGYLQTASSPSGTCSGWPGLSASFPFNR